MQTKIDTKIPRSISSYSINQPANQSINWSVNKSVSSRIKYNKSRHLLQYWIPLKASMFLLANKGLKSMSALLMRSYLNQASQMVSDCTRSHHGQMIFHRLLYFTFHANPVASFQLDSDFRSYRLLITLAETRTSTNKHLASLCPLGIVSILIGIWIIIFHSIKINVTNKTEIYSEMIESTRKERHFADE